MPLERHIDDLTACDGIKFWMSDGERPVLCRVSHEALRDLADRVHFAGSDEKVFEAYRELVEQVASDAYDAGTSYDESGLRSPEWAAAREEKSNREGTSHRKLISRGQAVTFPPDPMRTRACNFRELY
jgi:hypothetical protein